MSTQPRDFSGMVPRRGSFSPVLAMWTGCAALVLLLGLVLALQLVESRKDAVAEGTRDVVSVAVAAQRSIVGMLDAEQRVLQRAQVVAADAELSPEERNRRLEWLAAEFSELRAIALLDRNGRALAVGPQRSGLHGAWLDAAQLARHAEAMSGTHAVLGLPVQADDGRRVIVLAIAVKVGDVRWIAAPVDIDALQAMIAGIDLGPRGAIAILHRSGRMIARLPDDEKYERSDFSRGKLFRHLADAATGEFRGRSMLDGVDRVVAYRAGAPYPLVVMVGRSYEDMLRGWTHLRDVSALGVSGLALALLLLTGVLTRAYGRQMKLSEALRHRNERLHEAQRIGRLGMWEHDIASGAQSWSAEFYAILGLSPDTPPSPRALLASVHPGDRARVGRLYRRMRDGENASDCQLRLVRADGTLLHARLDAAARTDDEGRRLLLGAIQDITAVVAAADRIQRMEARYEFMFDRSPVPMWVFDSETLRIVAVNAMAVATYGYEVEEFVGKSILDLRPPEDVPRLLEFIRRAPAVATTGEVWRHLRRDGSVLFARTYGTSVDFDGRPARLVAAIDCTDKVEAERALLDSEQRFSLVARSSNDAIWDYDVRTDSHWWSEGYRRFGYDPDAGGGLESWAEHLHPDDRDRIMQSVQAAFADGSEEWNATYRYRRADGSYAYVLDRAFLVRDAEGRVVRAVGGMVDQTEQRAAQAALEANERTYRELMQGLPLPLLVVRDGHVVLANACAQQVLADGEVTLVGLPAADLFDASACRALAGGTGGRGRLTSWVRLPDGERFEAELALAEYHDAGGAGVQVVVRDLTDQRRFERRLAHQAAHDELTGLPNRRALRTRLEAMLAESASQQGDVAVLFIDLDQFKLINDTLGHAVGDEVLRQLTKRLSEAVDELGYLGRFGGDEFVLLMRAQRDGAALFDVLSRIERAVARPVDAMGTVQSLTQSIGIAIAPRDGNDPDTLIRNADAAMYEAKRAGRNRWVYYSGELHATAAARLSITSRLRQADFDRELELHFQTQHGDAGRVCGVEALLRWPGAPEGARGPDKFIPLYEETGLIIPVGRWVLREACRRQRDLEALLGAPCRMAINVSAQQFVHGDLVDEVREALVLAGAQPQRIELELTESVIMTDPQGAIDTMRRLRDLGVTIAIDDFGTGFSSLGYLKRFPVDRLKIDRSFVDDIVDDADDALICASIITLAHNLGLVVVAEGVETEAQARWLRDRGCDEMQGFLFSRPQPFAALAAAAAPRPVVRIDEHRRRPRNSLPIAG